MEKNSFQKNQVVVYQTKSGAIELRRDAAKETIWATQAQMAVIFGVNPQAITKHLKNIYRESELARPEHVPSWNKFKKNVQKMHIANFDTKGKS